MRGTTNDRGRTGAIQSRASAVVGGLVMVAMMAFSPPGHAKKVIGNRCDVCGTVVTTNRKDEKGSGTAGTVVGGVGGAVVGNVAGHSTTSTILGGVGGAVAGNLIGKRMTQKKIWSVQVRMDRGGTRDVDFTEDPRYRQGERVRIVDGAMSRL
jgi:outer membrane lipoprotein SlyB